MLFNLIKILSVVKNCLLLPDDEGVRLLSVVKVTAGSHGTETLHVNLARTVVTDAVGHTTLGVLAVGVTDEDEELTGEAGTQVAIGIVVDAGLLQGVDDNDIPTLRLCKFFYHLIEVHVQEHHPSVHFHHSGILK